MATNSQADPGDEEVSISGAAGAAGGDGNKIEIEVVDDTPEADRGRKALDKPVLDPDDDELKTYSAGVQNRLNELTHARHDERRAREAAERERDEAVNASRTLLERNRALAQRTTAGETHLVAASKANAEAALEAARKAWQLAKDNFDSEAELKAQDEMLEAKINLREIERYRPPPVQEAEEVVQLPPVQAEDVPLDQKTLRWQARNQWFGTDGNEEMTSFALGFHQKLVKSGIDPRSDEYFQKVDARLHQVFPDFFGGANGNGNGTDDRSTQRTRPATSPVAPATRQVNGVTKVRLTPTQVALAKKFGLTPQQYAQEVARLEQKQ